MKVFNCLILLGLVASCGSFADGQAALNGQAPEVTSSFQEGTAWQLIGPGDADQVTSLTVLVDGDVVLGTDIGGLYRSRDDGESWTSINEGLRNYDVTTPIAQSRDNPNVMLAGTRGGLYKTANGGANWRNIRRGLPEHRGRSLSGSIGSVVFDSINPKKVYAGLGYRPSSDGTATVKKLQWSRFIFASDDAGETWRKFPVFPKPLRVHELVPDPAETGLIYAATSGGVFVGRVTDKSWRRLLSLETYGLVVSGSGQSELIAAVGSEGIRHSVDGGRTWRAKNSGISFWPHPSGPNRYSVMAGSPSEIFVVNSTWGMSGGLYRSARSRLSWTKLTGEMPESWLKTSRRMNAVAVSPLDKDLIFLGSSRYVYRSVDGGDSWEQMISKPASGGWSNRGLNVFGHTRDVEINPDDDDHWFIATADHGAVESFDRGQSWRSLKSHPERSDTVMDLEFCRDGDRRTRLFASTANTKRQHCVSFSDDLGSSWRSLCDGLPAKPALKLHAVSRQCANLLAATGDGLYRLAPSGRSWVLVGSGVPKVATNALAQSSGTDATVVAGTDLGLFLSSDSGASWRNVLQAKNEKVTSAMISGPSGQVILAGVERVGFGSSVVYRSSNGGRSWKIVLSGLSKFVSGMVQVPGAPEIMYLSVNDHNYHDYSDGSGVYRSVDGGRSWRPMNQGLPVRRAWSMSVSDALPQHVFVSSNGSGAYYRVDQSQPNPNQP